MGCGPARRDRPGLVQVLLSKRILLAAVMLVTLVPVRDDTRRASGP